MFDIVEIEVRAGEGGSGMVSFRREKFVPFGGPDGGDGGDGGNVVLIADLAVADLRFFKHKRYYRAGSGRAGKGKKQHGRKGEDLEIRVPVGTVVSDKGQIGAEGISHDLNKAGERVVVAKGGRGGYGNTHFASSTYQSPQIAQRGEKGEEKSIILELKLIADVGIIGYPNAGKSTLLTATSAARPEIADYAFTTRSPVLGVVEAGLKTFVIAEIPGLIDGAHLGRGLGHDFLRHISRTRLLIHLIDGTSLSPVEDMLNVNMELSLYDSALAAKRQIVAVNKIDLPQVRIKMADMEASFASGGIRVFFISAATGEGVSELVSQAQSMLDQIGREAAAQPIPKKVFHPRPAVVTPEVHKEGDTFVVSAPELERFVTRMIGTDYMIDRQFKRQLQRLGIDRALARAGVRPGDRIRCGEYEWEWQ